MGIWWWSDWWFGTWLDYDFPFSWEWHHPNWRTNIFFRGIVLPPTREFSTWHWNSGFTSVGRVVCFFLWLKKHVELVMFVDEILSRTSFVGWKYAWITWIHIWLVVSIIFYVPFHILGMSSSQLTLHNFSEGLFYQSVQSDTIRIYLKAFLVQK